MGEKDVNPREIWLIFIQENCPLSCTIYRKGNGINTRRAVRRQGCNEQLKVALLNVEKKITMTSNNRYFYFSESISSQG